MYLRSGKSIEKKVEFDNERLGMGLYANKMTLGDLSVETGIDEDRLEDFLKGKSTPNKEELECLEYTLGLSLSPKAVTLQRRRAI